MEIMFFLIYLFFLKKKGLKLLVSLICRCHNAFCVLSSWTKTWWVFDAKSRGPRKTIFPPLSKLIHGKCFCPFFFFGSKAHGSWFSIKWLKKNCYVVVICFIWINKCLFHDRLTKWIRTRPHPSCSCINSIIYL
jgi:hypothetical protein